MRVSFFLLLLLFVSTNLFAQTITLQGRVSDEKGAGIPGASVHARGTRISAIADTGGYFLLHVKELPARLVFSSIGYVSKEYTVAEGDSSKLIAITLQPTDASLSEVVVTGYGTERRMMAPRTASVADGLSGRVSGVAVPGATSSIRLRGASSITTHSRKTKETAGFLAPPPEETKAFKRAVPHTGRANVLTAGELSDFKKWKLWNDYTTDEFRVHSGHWGMQARERYCVQVQNAAFKAVAGQRVYLLNGTRDTVWSAITDNTGKAELWASFDSLSQRKKAGYSLVAGGTVLRSPSVFENGINRMLVQQDCAPSNIVDIAFVVDATGSMADEIQYLQEELADVTGATAARFPDVRFRLGSVFYRDEGDEYVTRHLALQEDSKALIEFVKKQSAGGGGDFPEAVDAALATALERLQWSANARARILFLVLDAPPHDTAKERMNALVRKAAAMGVRIVPVVCSGIDKSTEYLMRCIALATNGSYVFLTDDSGVGNPHIKPTTDEFKVELLNALLQRLIYEMSWLPSCEPAAPLVQKPASNTASNILKLSLYPNPTVGRVTISASHSLTEIYLTDFTGKVLRRIVTNKGDRKWETDLSQYPSGTYLVKYFAEGKGWGSERVVLAR